jgi:hypothetical protein
MHGRAEGRGQEEGHGCTVTDADALSDRPPRGPNRKQRRLSDHILIAFHFACDQRDLEVADRLLGILERLILRPPPDGRLERRADLPTLVAALERLWTLRHPEAREQ